MKKLLYLIASLLIIPAYASTDTLMQKVGYPVLIGKDTAFLLYSRVGSFTPDERAKAITQRITQLLEEPFFIGDSLYRAISENSDEIFYRDRIMLSITDEDADYYGKSRPETAKDYMSRLKSGIEQYREQNSLKHILTNLLIVVMIIMSLLMFIRYFNLLFGFIKNRLGKFERTFTGIHFGSWQLLTPERQIALLHFMLKAIRVSLLIVIIYLSLPLLLNVFPGTQHLSGYLFSFLLAPLEKISLSAWNYLPDMLTIIAIVIVFIYVIKLFRFLRDEVANEKMRFPKFHADWAEPTFNIIRFLLLVFMFILIFPYLPGSGSPAFQGISVFIGFVFSMGSSSFVSNVLAGLSITYMRKFQIGDRVKIGDVTGDVIARSLLVTRVRTIKNEDIIIPNSTILSSHTTNYSSVSQTMGLVLHTTMTIGYDIPWKQVHELMINAAKNTEGILNDPQPYVYQTSLDDFYVSYQINAFTDRPNSMASIYSDLHKNLQDQFNAAGIEMLSPHYQAIRDGNRVAVAPEYLPTDYKTPAFNVNIKS